MKNHQRCHVLHPNKCLQKQYPNMQTHLAWESVSIAPFYRWRSWGPKRWGTSTGIMWYSCCWFLPNTFALKFPTYWGTQNLHSLNNQKEIKWSFTCVFSSSTTLMTLGLKKSLGNSVRQHVSPVSICCTKAALIADPNEICDQNETGPFGGQPEHS